MLLLYSDWLLGVAAGRAYSGGGDCYGWSVKSRQPTRVVARGRPLVGTIRLCFDRMTLGRKIG